MRSLPDRENLGRAERWKTRGVNEREADVEVGVGDGGPSAGLFCENAYESAPAIVFPLPCWPCLLLGGGFVMKTQSKKSLVAFFCSGVVNECNWAFAVVCDKDCSGSLTENFATRERRFGITTPSNASGFRTATVLPA